MYIGSLKLGWMKLRSTITFIKNTTPVSFKKGSVLIPEGAMDKTIFFLHKGLVRSFIMDNEKLEEITFQLYPELNIIANLHSILFDKPSRFIYQALEDTKAYRIDYASLLELTSKNSDLLEINRMYVGRKALERAFQRAESFVFLSPQERYEKYVKDYPNLVNRVPDKYIANVLGVTPVSLSRIRKRISKKK